MKVPPEQILAAFNNLPSNATDEDLLNFTTSYFYPSGTCILCIDRIIHSCRLRGQARYPYRLGPEPRLPSFDRRPLAAGMGPGGAR